MLDTVAFIIPGHLDSPKQKEYQLIAQAFKKENITPICVPIYWKYTTVSHWVIQFKKVFEGSKANKKIILGFSWGAIIAFVSGSELDVDTLILCSLSPWFAEDLPKLPKDWKANVGIRRVEDFKKIYITDLVKKIKSRTFLLYGMDESYTKRRSLETFEMLRVEKELIGIEGVKHELDDQRYLDKIFRIIKKL